MSDRYEAQWASTCPECGDRIRPGDVVRADDGAAVHDSCWVEEPQPCPDCWLRHAGDCPA